MAKTQTAKTRTIAGRRLTLVPGVRYMASRPFASRWARYYPVTIQPLFPYPEGTQSVTIYDLTWKQADALVNAFNNGEMSFDGRVW